MVVWSSWLSSWLVVWSSWLDGWVVVWGSWYNDQRSTGGDAQETLMGSFASFRFTKLGVGQLGSCRRLITAVEGRLGGDPCKEPEKRLLFPEDRREVVGARMQTSSRHCLLPPVYSFR